MRSKKSIQIISTPHITETKDVNAGYQKWLLWGIAALFYLYETFLRVAPSVMTHSLMEHYHVTSTSLGLLTSFYYYAYVPLQIPCGFILDKLGIRFILVMSCLLCIVGTLLFAKGSTLFMGQIGRFLLGAGSACAFISCLKISVLWFNPILFPLIAGLTNMMGTFGGLFAGQPLALLVNKFGWQDTTLYLGFCGVPILFLVWVFFNTNKAIAKTQSPDTGTFKDSLRHIMRNKNIWLAGIVGGFMYLPISAFAEIWGVPFFMQSHGINNEIASSMSHMVFVGMAIGSPLVAWLVDWVKSLVLVMKYCALFAGLCFIGITYSTYLPIFYSYILVFLAGLFIGGQVLCFTISKNYSTPALEGSAIGFTNALVMMSGIIFQPLLGKVLDLFWDGALTAKGIRMYSTHAYQMSMLIIPIFFIISVIMLYFIKNQSLVKNP